MGGALLALPFGLSIGLILGLVGGGGSILAVPVLVYVLGEPVHEATTESLVVVGCAALVGSIDHARVGNIRAKIAAVFGLAGAVGSVGGTALNRLVSGPIILLGFAALLVVAALALVRRRDIIAKPRARRRSHLHAAAAGLVTGVLTGFFGVGGGFVIVPALTILLDLPITAAVGTSLLVIALTSSAALGAHLTTGSIDWRIAAAFTVAAVAGTLLGRRVGTRLDPHALASLFALLLAAVAVVLVLENAAALL